MSFTKTLERIITLETLIIGITNKAHNADRALTIEERQEVNTYKDELISRNRWLRVVSNRE